MPKLVYITVIVILISILSFNTVYAKSDMKKLFTAIPWDKQLHFTWGFVLTATITAITGSFVIGISLALLLEIVKEYIIDDFPDCEDIIYTVTGVLFGYLISNILMNLGRTEANSSY
ncbi:MAG: hypothetical protein N2380_01745 [bacterium]|nr:hypothetical protein [bacterium]